MSGIADELHLATLTELAAGLDRGEFSARELTERLLGRIEAHRDTLNAFVTVTAEDALSRADRADGADTTGRAARR